MKGNHVRHSVLHSVHTPSNTQPHQSPPQPVQAPHPEATERRVRAAHRAQGTAEMDGTRGGETGRQGDNETMRRGDGETGKLTIDEERGG